MRLPLGTTVHRKDTVWPNEYHHQLGFWEYRLMVLYRWFMEKVAVRHAYAFMKQAGSASARDLQDAGPSTHVGMHLKRSRL